MAVSSTTVTVCISRKDFSSLTPVNVTAIFVNSVAFATKPSWRFPLQIRASSEVSGETSTSTSTEADPESAIEAPKGISLISALNVERALRGIPITDVDHYGRLGLRRDCSLEQVLVAYKSKAEELRNQGLDEEELDKKLEVLRESYIILSSEEERRMYDWSLARSEKADTYIWPFEVDETPTSKESPPILQEPEDVGPTRLVGYFILGWMVLSFALSIALNQ
ncbi:NAD(P)H-quinone oxidoreductase subunit U, chloroplastic [Juglans regia]|uniref:NAD(P)H-quinone oxidoreductase subunit U, chloroplastic n=2 Tax=Juglans regia TaxID=51240 RepID=A0A2I4DMK8_JUGRE|nr:NAD(P)H-quinone oxidoreductase subunit U, chloroplastic [Juglans regia]